MTTVLAAGTCALAPAYVIRWHVGFLPTTLLENAILLTGLAFLVESVLERRRPHWRSALLAPALLFLVAGAISVPTAPSPIAALGIYRAYLLEPIAFGWILLNIVRTPGRALAVVSGLWTGATVVGLANAAVVAIAVQNHAYDVVNTPPVVIYSTANAVALFVVPLVAVAGAVTLHGAGPARYLGAAFVAIGTLVTVLSFSRGGYLALAAVVTGLAISHRRRILLALGAVVLAAGLALVPQVRRRVVIEVTNGGGSTTASRVDLWVAAVKLIQHRPLLGGGLSGFQVRSAPYFSHAHTYADFIYPHNILLNFWVETGLLGLLSMAWIIGASALVNFRAWLAAPEAWRPYHLGVLLALVAIIVHGQVDVPYFKNDLSLEFWALLGVSAAAGQWGGSPLGR